MDRSYTQSSDTESPIQWSDEVDCKIQEVCKEQQLNGDEMPFYVVDLQDVHDKCQLWKSELPMVTPFYAMKCNPDVEILKLVKQNGFGFDCASKVEMEAVLGLGVAADRIIVANTYKQKHVIRYTAEHDVHLMTFDTEAELHKIKDYNPNAKVVLRMKAPECGEKLVSVKLGDRFGCYMHSVGHLLETCVNVGLEPVGVSFHVGSNCYQADGWSNAIELAKQVFDLADNMGLKLSVLDIGGGFPSNKEYFKKVAFQIRDTISRTFPIRSGVRIVSEPGRFLVETSTVLKSTVIGRDTSNRIRVLNSKSENDVVRAYTLDVGAYSVFLARKTFSKNDKIHVPVVKKTLKGPNDTRPSILYGPSCSSEDTIYSNIIQLPELFVGDHVMFGNAGAYTSCIATQFNGIEQPHTYYLQPRTSEILQ